jgi:cyclase
MFSHELVLNMNDFRTELTHVAGHTSATIMVYVPSDRVAFMGDNLTNGEFPFTGDGRFKSWIELLERVEKMDVDVIVPGHGEVCDKQPLRILRAYFEELRHQVTAHRQAGLSKEQALAKIEITGNVPSWKPLPGFDMAGQVVTDAGRMYDQMENGLL